MKLSGWFPEAFCSVRIAPKGSYDHVHWVAPDEEVRFATEPSPSWRKYEVLEPAVWEMRRAPYVYRRMSALFPSRSSASWGSPRLTSQRKFVVLFAWGPVE